VQLLNAQLASALDLHLRVRQSHWSVRGPQFFARHGLFDQLGDHLHDMADTLAERIGALGGLAHGASRHVTAHSELPDAAEDMSDITSHLRALVQCYSAFSAQLRRALARSRDLVTEDVLVETLRTVEKDMWFLDRHLPDTATAAAAPRPPAPEPEVGATVELVEEEELAVVMYS
jgi:starvation-inducible DNA-binding protein